MFTEGQVLVFKSQKYIVLDKWKDGTGYRYEIKKAHGSKPLKTTQSWSVSETRLLEENKNV